MEKIKVPAHQFVPNQCFSDIGRNPIRKAEFAKCSWCAKKDIQASVELSKKRSNHPILWTLPVWSWANTALLHILELQASVVWIKPSDEEAAQKPPHPPKQSLPPKVDISGEGFLSFRCLFTCKYGNRVSIYTHVTYHVLALFHPGRRE